MLSSVQVGCNGNTKELGTQYASGTGTGLCKRETLRNDRLRRACPVCGDNMGPVECTDPSEGYKWKCRKRANNKRHKITVSIRKGS